MYKREQKWNKSLLITKILRQKGLKLKNIKDNIVLVNYRNQVLICTLVLVYMLP